MITDLIIKKNNVLTDGNIPDRKVLTEKVVNILYHQYEKYGVEFDITVPDMLRMLNMNTTGNNPRRLKETLQTLQGLVELRSFDYKGKTISWFSAPFLNRAYIEKGSSNVIKFKLDNMLIEILKKHSTYTEVDINISNQFKTKYGITIWQMYLRYKKMKTQGSDANHPQLGVKTTTHLKTLEELNKKFCTNYKKPSEMMRSLKRGLLEIRSITNKYIYITYNKETKTFIFTWELESDIKTSIKDFKNWIRKNFKNRHIHNVVIKKAGIKGMASVGVNDNGYLYDLNEVFHITKDEAKKIWKLLFEKQEQILTLKN
jgi:hypothetical protein